VPPRPEARFFLTRQASPRRPSADSPGPAGSAVTGRSDSASAAGGPAPLIPVSPGKRRTVRRGRPVMTMLVSAPFASSQRDRGSGRIRRLSFSSFMEYARSKRGDCGSIAPALWGSAGARSAARRRHSGRQYNRDAHRWPTTRLGCGLEAGAPGRKAAAMPIRNPSATAPGRCAGQSEQRGMTTAGRLPRGGKGGAIHHRPDEGGTIRCPGAAGQRAPTIQCVSPNGNRLCGGDELV